MLNLETSQKHSICGLLSPFFRLQRQSITSLPLALAYSCLSLWSHGQSKASACVMRGAGRVLTQPFLHCVSFYTFPPLTCRLHVSYSALSLWLIRGLLCHPQSVLTRNRNAETSITLHLSPPNVSRGCRTAILWIAFGFALQSRDAHSSLLLGVSCPRQ